MNRAHVFIVGIIVVLIAAGGYVFLSKDQSGDVGCTLEGSIVGANPDNLSMCELPRCVFTGAVFVEKPCYSAPDDVYL